MPEANFRRQGAQQRGQDNQQRNQRYKYQYAKGPEQKEYLSLVEHAMTREGIACIKFDVILSQPNRSTQA